jgi:hypothetical protein
MNKRTDEKEPKKKLDWKPDENISMVIRKSKDWKPDKKLRMKFQESVEKKKKTTKE